MKLGLGSEAYGIATANNCIYVSDHVLHGICMYDMESNVKTQILPSDVTGTPLGLYRVADTLCYTDLSDYTIISLKNDGTNHNRVADTGVHGSEDGHLCLAQFSQPSGI